jgi:hypothetical protein
MFLRMETALYRNTEDMLIGVALKCHESRHALRNNIRFSWVESRNFSDNGYHVATACKLDDK